MSNDGGELCSARCAEQPFDVAFHPGNNGIFVSGLITGAVEVWEHKGDRVRKLKTIDAHTEAVRTLGFVNDGALLLTGSSDRSILALDTATGKPLAKLEHAHKSAVNRLRVLDRNLVATGCDDGVVKVWDTRQQTACGSFAPFVDFVSDICHVPADADDAVASGANGPNGSLVVTSGDGTIAHLNMANWKELGQSDNQEDELLSCVVMKNGKKAVAGSQTGTLSIFNYGQWEDISDRFPGHPSSIDAMIKVDEETLLTGSSDGIVRIIGILPNKMLGLVGEHGEMPIERMALSGDNKFLATASHDRTIKLWDVGYLWERDLRAEAANFDGAGELEEEEDDSDSDSEGGGGKRKRKQSQKQKKGGKVQNTKGAREVVKKQAAKKFFDGL